MNRFAVVALALAGGPARADDAPPLAKQIIGADAVIVKPVDNYGDDASIAFGPWGRFERRLGSKLSIIARGGPLFHDATVDGQSVFMFVAFGGMRMNIDADRRNGSFFDAAIGMNVVRVAVDSVGVKASDTEAELALEFAGGYQFGRFQLRASLFYTPSVGASFGGDSNSYLGLAFNLGVDISSK